jgi:hypothetical protein
MIYFFIFLFRLKALMPGVALGMIIVKSGYIEKWIKLCFQKGGAGDERELGLRVGGPGKANGEGS